MPAPFNTILQKVEEALAIRIATETNLAAVPVVIHQGVSIDMVEPPCIIIRAEQAAPRPDRRGNWRVQAVVELWTSADNDPAAVATHRARTAYLADVLMTDSLAIDLSADLADFRVFGALESLVKASIEGRKFSWSYELHLDCAPSDV